MISSSKTYHSNDITIFRLHTIRVKSIHMLLAKSKKIIPMNIRLSNSNWVFAFLILQEVLFMICYS